MSLSLARKSGDKSPGGLGGGVSSKIISSLKRKDISSPSKSVSSWTSASSTVATSPVSVNLLLQCGHFNGLFSWRQVPIHEVKQSLSISWLQHWSGEVSVASERQTIHLFSAISAMVLLVSFRSLRWTVEKWRFSFEFESLLELFWEEIYLWTESHWGIVRGNIQPQQKELLFWNNSFTCVKQNRVNKVRCAMHKQAARQNRILFVMGKKNRPFVKPCKRKEIISKTKCKTFILASRFVLWT